MLKLIVIDGPMAGKEFRLFQTRHILGRAMDADVVLPSQNVSRHHARVDRTPAGWVVEDMGSRNGTLLNSVPVQKSPIKPGDIISLGGIKIRCEDEPDIAPKPLNPNPGPLEPTTLIRSTESLFQELEQMGPRPTRQTGPFKKISQGAIAAPSSADVEHIRRDAMKLKILYDVSRELISIRPLAEFLDLVMDLVFEVVRAGRGVLQLKDETGQLVTKVSRVRKKGGTLAPAPDNAVTISSTIAEKATKERVAVLTTDALSDDRFVGGESIQMLGIRSAMCVPLQVKENVLGLVYVDTLISSGIFDSDDLALLTAFASHAAAGIEQARLNEKVQDEIRMRSKLERYHSPRVIESILMKGSVDLEPEVKEVTVLFADIKGFTTMAEELPPGEVAQLLNEYYTMMTEVIFEYSGTLDKFMGDAVMALFGAPVSLANDAERAVAAAVTMQKRLTERNLEVEPEQRFQMRIGVNTGKTLAGDFGSEKRKEYTVLGHTVNIASRLEHEVCQPGQIAIGEDTYQQVKDKFPCRQLGSFTVKGMQKPVAVYGVEWEKK